jgi:hypothetical protein
MPSLADILNSPRIVEFENTKWKLRQPTIGDEGRFQAWLEQEAFERIEQRRGPTKEQKLQDWERVRQSALAGNYEYGRPLAIKAMSQTKGIAAMLRIVCRKQGMTEPTSRSMAAQKFKEVASIFGSKLPLEERSSGESGEGGNSRSDFLIWLCNPPFNHSIHELRRMSWDQIIITFDIDRTKEGHAKFMPSDSGKQMTAKDMFRRRYFLLGITDQSIVDEEWLKWKAKQEEEINKDPHKRKLKQTRRHTGRRMPDG